MGLKGKGRELPVSVRLNFPINMGNNERRAVLEIHDETAAILLLEVELNAEQLLSLLGNSAAHVNAYLPARLDHVGKQMEHGSMTWDDGYTTKEHEARTRAEEWRSAGGWETLDLYQAHGKWRATGCRWVDPQE